MLELASPAPTARSTLPLLAAANFAAASAGMLVAGLLQLIATDLAWSPATAGRLIVWYSLAFALGAPLLGALFATSCRKHVVVWGLLLVAAGSGASALAAGSPWLEGARVVVAAGSAMTVPAVAAIASFLYPADRSRALAYVLAGMTLAIVIGLPLGTLLGAAFGWRVPLAAAAAAALLAAAAVKRWLPGGIVVPPVPLRAWARLLGDVRSYPLLGLSLLAIAAVFVVYGYIAPFLAAAADVDARTLAWLLLWYGVVSLGCNALVAPLERRLGTNRALIGSLLLLALALAALAAAGRHPLVVVGAFALWAAASTMFAVVQQSRLASVAPAAGPAILALNTSATFAGQAVGTAIGGTVQMLWSLGALPWAAASVAVVGALLMHLSRDVRLD